MKTQIPPAAATDTATPVGPAAADSGKPAKKLSVKEKLAYSTGGGISSFTLNAPNYLANPILNLTFGLNPALIGVVLAVARLWDAVMDPLVGYMSDNTRSRWGQRKPYMLIGGVGLGVMFALMWWLPRGGSKDFYFWWFLITTLLFYTANSLFMVPWSAIGVSMTKDYNERTTLNAYVGAAHKLIGMVYGWLFPVAQLAVFQNVAQGARIVGVICGGALTIASLMPIFLIKEKVVATVSQKRESLVAAFKVICSNRVFLKLAGVNVLTMTSLMTVSSLNLYINIYYIFGGDAKKAAAVAAVFGMWFNLLAIAAIPLVTALSRRLGKHRAVMICLGLVSLSAILKWFLYTPNYPYLQFVIPILHAPGLSAFYVLVNSMTADLVDYDEFVSGRRREALIGAANQWMTKLGMSSAYISAGLILTLNGFVVEKGIDQAASTITGMRVCFSAIPAMGTMLAIFLLIKYPLDKLRMQQVQDELEARNPRSRS